MQITVMLKEHGNEFLEAQFSVLSLINHVNKYAPKPDNPTMQKNMCSFYT